MSLFLRIETAEDLSFPDGRRVGSREAYLAWHLYQIEARRLARVWRCEVFVAGYINHGRWVADCSVCSTGMLTHPEWNLACCGECGAVHVNMLFPENIKEIEAALLERLRPNQNWHSWESPLDLIAENIANRIGV